MAMREEIGRKLQLRDGRTGVCVNAYPDIKSGKGLEMVVAVGAETRSEAEEIDPSLWEKVNSRDILPLHSEGN